mgnify:CR=1 FL=1
MKKNLIYAIALFSIIALGWIASLSQVSGQEKNLSKYKGESIYKQPVDADKLPRGKFWRGNPNAIPGEYIVIFSDGVQELEVEPLAEELVKIYGGKIEDKKHILRHNPRGFIVKMSEAEAEKMSTHEKIDHITENVRVKSEPALLQRMENGRSIEIPPPQKKPEVEEDDEILSLPSGPSDSQTGVDYNLDRIDQRNNIYNGTYNYDYTGQGVTVYVVDSGIKVSHNQFSPNRASVLYNYVNDGIATDCSGHGTGVASVIGGSVVGVAKNVNLVGIRVMDCNDSFTIAILLQAINDLTNVIQVRPIPKMAIVNMSLLVDDPTRLYLDLDNALFRLIRDYDTIVVCGIGQKSQVGGFGTVANAGDNIDYFPGRVNGVISVGMTDNRDRKVSKRIYPNGWLDPGAMAPVTVQIDTAFGSSIDVFAPGGPYNVNGTVLRRGVLVADGSPSATNTAGAYAYGVSPLVAGVAAQYLQINRYAHYFQVWNAIRSFATTGQITDFTPGGGEPNLLLYSNFALAATRNAASYFEGVAPSSLAVAFSSYPSTPTKITVENDSGVEIQAQTSFLGIGQVNFLIPSTISHGEAHTVRVYSGNTLIAHGVAQVNRLAVGLFSANGSGVGLASGQFLRVNRVNPAQQTYETLTQTPGNTMNPDTEDSYLILYGTGIRLRSSLSTVSAKVGGVSVPVTYAGAQGTFDGQDQVNIGPLPASLKGQGESTIELKVENQTSAQVKVWLR